MKQHTAHNSFNGGSAVARLYWGWYVVMGAFIMLGINYGARYSFGVFVGPMFEDYGWSMSVISLAATINLIMYATGGVVWGRLMDRTAPRWIMTGGVIVTATGFLAVSVIDSPFQLYLFFGIFCGLGGSCFGLVVSSSSVGKWFVRRRGVAVGVGTMGVGLGTLIMTPLAGWIVKHFSWQAGFLAIGAAILLVGLLVSQTLMRKSTPERYGMYPDGGTIGQCPRDTDCPEPDLKRASMRSILVDSRFWILALCYSAASLVVLMMFVHQVAYAVKLDIGHVMAASSLGILGVSSIFGRFFYGWLSDRLRDPMYAGQIGLFIMILGMLILTRAASPGGLYLYAVIFGFGYGSLAPMPPILLSHRFGRHILGSTYGALSFFMAGIGSMGPLLGGVLYDVTGSYNLAWKINMGMLVFAMAVLFFLRQSASPER